MYGADDDVDFFTPTPASAAHLASLFQGIAGGGEASQDLVYTAPKQPKVEAAKPKPRTNNKVICAKTVQLYKLADSDYVPLGRHGVAVIGDPDAASYDLIVYLSRQNILSASKLGPAFTYAQHDVVIGQFVDDQRRTFRAHFDDSKEHGEFVDELRKTGATVMNVGTAEPADDQLSDGSQARAHILERISKVGQSMLPPPTSGKNPDLSESEPDEVVKTKKVVRKPKRHSTSEKEMTDGYEAQQQQQPTPSQQYMLPVAASQPYTLSQYVPNQLVQCVPGQVMSLADPLAVHFAENRTHNSEVRMNLSQLSNKLDSVLSELTNLRSVPPSIAAPPDRSYLLNKIEELERKLGRETEMREQLEHGRNVNTNLKNDVDELRKRIEEREASVAELERCKAEAEARVAEQRARIAELENCTSKNDVVSELRETTERQVGEISSLTRNNENLRITIKELEDKVENYRLKLEDFTEHQKSDQSPDKLERERIEEDLRRAAQKQAEENESLRLTIKELEEKVENYRLIVDNFTEHRESNQLPDKLEEAQKQAEENESLRLTIKELEDKVENYRLKLEDFAEYYDSNKLPDKLERERIKEDKVKAFSENVKTYMNVMYQNILDWTNVDGSFRKSLTQNMKSVTFHIIQVYRDSLNEAELIESTDVKDDTALPPAVPEFEVTV